MIALLLKEELNPAYFPDSAFFIAKNFILWQN